MVVADPRFSQRRLARAGHQSRRPAAEGDAGQRFEGVRHLVVGEAEVAVPALRFHGQQLGLEQLAQVRARCLPGDAGGLGQLGGGERAAAEQGGQHLGARRLADETGDAGDVGAVPHGRQSRRGARRDGSLGGRTVVASVSRGTDP